MNPQVDNSLNIGVREDRTWDTIYLAETNGFLSVDAVADGDGVTIEILVEEATPPDVCLASSTAESSGEHTSVCCFVLKGEYFHVTGDDFENINISWTPLI